MLIDSSKMSVMDISRFVNESNKFREYKDFRIETDSYVLMTKPMFDRLIEIADRHGECIYPTKRYRKHGGIYSKMLNYNIDSVQSAEKLIRLCEKYHDDMDIDIMHGRTVVDGCSLLGVTSLIGRFVTVVPNTADKEMLQKFAEELETVK